LQAIASSHPDEMSDDDEKADGADSDDGTRHSEPHRYPNEGQVHTGGPDVGGKHLTQRGASERITSCRSLVCPIPDTWGEVCLRADIQEKFALCGAFQDVATGRSARNAEGTMGNIAD
jgi:hypothetical protein